MKKLPYLLLVPFSVKRGSGRFRAIKYFNSFWGKKLIFSLSLVNYFQNTRGDK